jgi:hypothetical protein
MKLSEIKGSDALGAMGDILQYLGVIAQDSEVQRLAADSSELELISYILKNFKEEILTVLAILNNTPVEEYQPTFTELMKEVNSLIHDEDILSLFR